MRLTRPLVFPLSAFAWLWCRVSPGARSAPRPICPPAGLTPELEQAWRLVAAIDAGGVPLNPARVNHIARGLGLEVSSRAPMDATIERIRAALAR